MPVAWLSQVQPPCRERLHPLQHFTPIPTHDADLPQKLPHYGTAPKAEISEPFTAPLPPYPGFLAEEAGTTEKEPCQKTGSVPPFRKDTALRGLSAPLSLIPNSDGIPFLPSCRIHNMLWTRVLSI